MTVTNDNDGCGLSLELQEFYDSHTTGDTIHELLLASSKAPRFIRLNPRYDPQETLKNLTAEMKIAPKPISWLDPGLGFYSIDGEFKLAQSPCFRSGRVYGMDVSSGAAVAVLLSERYDKQTCLSLNVESQDFRVLDLCCCPGLKLCTIVDFMESMKKKRVTVVGVDISEQRLSLCTNIVKKYHVNATTSGRDQGDKCKSSVRLYHADGVSFGLNQESDRLVFDSGTAFEDCILAGKRKRMNKSAKAREKKKLRKLMTESATSASTSENCSHEIQQFDRILVDAECSTDGSIKHVQQQLKKSMLSGNKETTPRSLENPTLTDPIQLSKLVVLQKGLIATGFRLLKSGGYLVYSTCSLSTEQNENVVQWLLGRNLDYAELVPVSFNVNSAAVVEGSIAGTVRFLPVLPNKDDHDFFGGGFFLAKIRKK